MTVSQLHSRLGLLILEGRGDKDTVVCNAIPRRGAPHTRTEITNVAVDPDDGTVEIEAVHELR